MLSGSGGNSMSLWNLIQDSMTLINLTVRQEEWREAKAVIYKGALGTHGGQEEDMLDHVWDFNNVPVFVCF